jgi:hypothetical protein
MPSTASRLNTLGAGARRDLRAPTRAVHIYSQEPCLSTGVTPTIGLCTKDASFVHVPVVAALLQACAGARHVQTPHAAPPVQAAADYCPLPPSVHAFCRNCTAGRAQLGAGSEAAAPPLGRRRPTARARPAYAARGSVQRQGAKISLGAAASAAQGPGRILGGPGAGGWPAGRRRCHPFVVTVPHRPGINAGSVIGRLLSYI